MGLEGCRIDVRGGLIRCYMGVIEVLYGCYRGVTGWYRRVRGVL